jgi:hypothetical protein
MFVKKKLKKVHIKIKKGKKKRGLIEKKTQIK